jgi:hypothetical protein
LSRIYIRIEGIVASLFVAWFQSPRRDQPAPFALSLPAGFGVDASGHGQIRWTPPREGSHQRCYRGQPRTARCGSVLYQGRIVSRRRGSQLWLMVGPAEDTDGISSRGGVLSGERPGSHCSRNRLYADPLSVVAGKSCRGERGASRQGRPARPSG